MAVYSSSVAPGLALLASSQLSLCLLHGSDSGQPWHVDLSLVGSDSSGTSLMELDWDLVFTMISMRIVDIEELT